MKFRKKPVIIDADKWDPTNSNAVSLANLHGWDINHHGNVFINTLEGRMKAEIGDWIIRGVKGEYYPCKPDIFEASYEKVIDE